MFFEHQGAKNMQNSHIENSLFENLSLVNLDADRSIHSSISKLTDRELLTKVKTLSQKERELTLSILHHLREVERRKLYSALKYPSLYEYCRHELGYSSGSAHRRIDSMKLLKEIP
mgnify:FL=1